MINRANTRRIAVALALGGALLVTYPAVSGGVLWDVGAACGYVCLVLFVCLYVFPVRGDGLPHARLLGLSQHKTVGWCVLGAAAAHVVVVLVAEPLSLRYLRPSAPIFMWCGLVAMLCVIASVITGLSARSHMRRAPALARVANADVSRAARATSPALRSAQVTAAASPPGGETTSARTAAAAPPRHGEVTSSRAAAPWASRADFRATLHLVLAAVLILTASAHVIGSAQVLSGTLKPIVVLLLLGLPLGWYALRRRPALVTARRASHVVAVVLIALLPATTAKQMLLEPATRPSPIALNFPHDKHLSVTCVACHHNYIDHTGTEACVLCHRSSRSDLVHSAESTFHTFCRDCHTQLASDSHTHGPTRSCAACHQGIRSNNL